MATVERDARGRASDQRSGRWLLRAVLRFVVLLWHFAPVLVTLPLAFWSRTRPWWARRLVGALERSGATFIKLGQIASSRPDILPQEVCDALAKLHDQAPAHPPEETEVAIAAAFGRPVSEIFAELSPEPIASGSIAQVHEGRLHDGRRVAVKVRHPGVPEQVAIDLAVIRGVARLLDRIPTARWLALPEGAEEFSRTMWRQVDLAVEAEHLERFRANFADHDDVRFPEPIHPWVAPSVLVESFEEGEPIARYVERRDPRNPQLARLGIETFLKMVFQDGFVHADLHPGNIFVRDAGERLEVILLDAGMVADLDEEKRHAYTAFFACIAAGDGLRGADLMLEHSPHHACTDPEGFRRELAELYMAVRDRPLSEIQVAAIAGQTMQILRRYRIQLESAFTSVNVGVMVLEGLGRQLDPDLNLIEIAMPHLLPLAANNPYLAGWSGMGGGAASA